MARVLINPAAGRGRAAALGRRLAGRADLELRLTRDPAELAAEARAAADEGLERVLVAGGDGTLHQAIQSLGGTDCALALLPVGSGNDLARALGLPLAPEAALERALGGRVRRIDLGRIGSRAFAGVAGIGFDGEVARYANERVRWLRGPLVYPWAVLRTLFTFRAPRLVIDHEAGRFEGRALLAVLANTPCFGGGMWIAPRASVEDGWLDLVIVGDLSRLRLLALLPALYARREPGHPAIRRLRVRRARVRADRALAFWGDGERLAPTQDEGTTIEVWPRALAVVA